MGVKDLMHKVVIYFWHQNEICLGKMPPTKIGDNTETMAVSVHYLSTRMSCHLAKRDTEPQNH